MHEKSLEVVTAIRAVVMASELCRKIEKNLVGRAFLVKSDRSPVTVADYGSQAIICKVLKEAFPKDTIVAEEDSAELRKPGHSAILEQVTHYVSGFIPVPSPEAVCSWIDFGSRVVTDRFWTLDPIDGTKGFLRGEQYAVALAFIENGLTTLGILACPNLPVDKGRSHGERGCLFLGLRGKGAVQMNIGAGNQEPLSVSNVKDPSEATLIESVEPDHADHLLHRRLAQKLNIWRPPLQMDSQAKYGMVARGEATIYLRVPSISEPGYQEKIWDHAAGAIITEEAGGRVTDVLGHPLDFSCGVEMEKNHGIVATNGIVHDIILEALKM